MARVRVAIVRLAIQLLSSGLPMDVGQAGWLVSDWGTSLGKRASSAGQGRPAAPGGHRGRWSAVQRCVLVGLTLLLGVLQRGQSHPSTSPFRHGSCFLLLLLLCCFSKSCSLDVATPLGPQSVGRFGPRTALCHVARSHASHTRLLPLPPASQAMKKG